MWVDLSFAITSHLALTHVKVFSVCQINPFEILFSIVLDYWPNSSMFANGPGDQGSIPGRVLPKTQKIVLDATVLNTQHYNIRIKGKVK